MSLWLFKNMDDTIETFYSKCDDFIENHKQKNNELWKVSKDFELISSLFKK